MQLNISRVADSGSFSRKIVKKAAQFLPGNTMPNLIQSEFPIYTHNSGSVHNTPTLPLPPAQGLPHKINTYEDVDEPRFDPKIHLTLGRPQYLRLLPGFDKADKCPLVNSCKGSRFAYSSPFQVEYIVRVLFCASFTE